MSKREVIATLIEAGRPDLANHVAYKALARRPKPRGEVRLVTSTKTFWQTRYMQYSGKLESFAKDMDRWAQNIENTAGKSDPASKKFSAVAVAARKIIKDLGFLKSFSTRDMAPEKPEKPARPIAPPPDVQRAVNQLKALPVEPVEKSALQKLLEQFKKLRRKPTPEEEWQKFRKNIEKLAKRGKFKGFQRAAAEITGATRLDRDHAFALVREAMRTELSDTVSRRDLLAWFRGTAWADLYRPHAFAKAVDDLIHSGLVARAGTKLLLVG